MKVFELSKKNGMKEIDYIRHRIELGKEVYAVGAIGHEQIDELCDVLYEFTQIMKGYQIDAYQAHATSAIREASNMLIVLNRIKLRTNLDVHVLSNSEQRFLRYKAIASKENEFNKMIKNGTAIVDIGGGSLQISLFDNDSLFTTQNLRLGTLRIREALVDIESETIDLSYQIEELINYELFAFKKMYLKDCEIKNIIAGGDVVTEIIRKITRGEEQDFITRKQLMEYWERLNYHSKKDLVEKLEISSESASLILPAAIIFRRIIEEMNAEVIWIPGGALTDGSAYDYAQQNKIIQTQHNFENDILAAAKQIAKRYMSTKSYINEIEKLALTLFDGMKKIHGLGKRDRLLLQIAALLNECGKYISLSYSAECSYNIIISTEIIGLSHLEREMIANIVKYNTLPLPPQKELANKLDSVSYLRVAKLTAILRVSKALDKSHKEKFKNCKVVLKDKTLQIVVDTMEDIKLERTWLKKKAEFFEEVFSLQPIIKRKKKM
ncbi:exopolyphosphatase [Anaerosacchariphilus polymeriproducens]|uniref:Exopolyphosphatase n=2 Tax=Anaerosacchariphilus polymeriproducens TaxID=1812858 RepID=A0A371ASU9_9FIRM|nr:exopolyphosphatase [Anaerosacchariphilus polymeriproducens]